MTKSLWGEEFDIPQTPAKTKKVVDKIANPKTPKVVSRTSSSTMKKLSLTEKLAYIKTNVTQILGKYESDTQVITDLGEFEDYITCAVNNGIIAVDTETNNSLDPISCKLMGLCLYTPGRKNLYVPINHVNPETNERLEEQLTELDVFNQLSRLRDTKVLTHNGKFDYEVIKCTTGAEIPIYWDTMVGAKVLDENEKSAGLKQQYIEKIDPSIQKYSIDHLFEAVEYAVVSYNLFALYAATDAFMTYKLYEWQKKHFEKPENEKIYSLFRKIEMPIVTIAAEMELAGVCIDIEYARRLSEKYHKKVVDVDARIAAELSKYSTQIAEWRKTPEANIHPPKKSGEGEAKSKSEQLNDPPALSSPTQLAILLYDVLKQKSKDSKSPRGTGEDILVQMKLPICELILEKRGLDKLIGTYIDKMPAIVEDTKVYEIVDVDAEDTLIVSKYSQVKTLNGYLQADRITIGTVLEDEHCNCLYVTDVHHQDDNVTIVFRQCYER